MPEKFAHNIPDRAEAGSPQEKLEQLLKELTEIQSESHDAIPADIREAGILAKKNSIAELKAEFPELNN